MPVYEQPTSWDGLVDQKTYRLNPEKTNLIPENMHPAGARASTEFIERARETLLRANMDADKTRGRVEENRANLKEARRVAAQFLRLAANLMYEG